MNIGLVDVDGKRHPNLALMKIAAYHKAQGDHVEWADALFGEYDRVYKSKVFTFTPDDTRVFNCEVVRGGTGYGIYDPLPDEIDRMQPDYSIYPDIDSKTAYGFLTRGCPNKCKWCIVPKKEGPVRPYMDVDDIAIDGRTNLILMDNNVLASEYGIEQIRKIVARGYRVDFNQALDARLVTDEVAQLLAQVKWLKRIRFGCDTKAQVAQCGKAVELIDKYGYKGEYFFYCILMGDEQECLNRINHWRNKGHRYMPYAQPYRDFTGKFTPPHWQRDMARWCNRKELLMTCEYEEYSWSKRKAISKGEDKLQGILF